MNIINPFARQLLVSALLTALSSVAMAAPSNDELKSEIDALKSQIDSAAEWRNPNSLVHVSGYAAVGFSKTDATGDDGSFNLGSFSPIFHFQYRDMVMLESELEIETGDDGATNVKLEYLTIDWLINDNVVLVAGQFLSPIGQFRQNLHPSWINKLPSAPPGFGHDGAAPVSDLGVQLRGGFHLGSMKANYAIYMGNGPELMAEIEEDAVTPGLIDMIEYDGVKAEAFGADRDGEKVIGGRIGLLPMPSLEIGLSFLSGKATVTEYEGDISIFAPPPPDLDTAATASDYDVTGVDLNWQYADLDARYEYIKSEVGANTLGAFALEAAEWTTWYAQFSYKFVPTGYELVVRYTDFDSAHAAADVQQTTVGLNYLFASNFIGKLAVESNDNPNTGLNADDRWLLQLAYGF